MATKNPWRRYGDEKPKINVDIWIIPVGRRKPHTGMRHILLGDYYWSIAGGGVPDCEANDLWCPCEPPPLPKGK